MSIRLAALPVLALAGTAHAQESLSDLFRKFVQPVIANDCVGCHGEGQAMGKLDLRTREAMLKGGARGPAVVPGDPAKSLLYQAVLGKGALQMPPGGDSKRLDPEIVTSIRRWIEGGAPWSERKQSYSWGAFQEEDLWAFRPLKKQFQHSSIDAFVTGKLIEKGLAPAPAADRRALIRRLTMDLTGLPPSPEEAETFLNDESPQAWKNAVDRLLASKHYGERWGRHWLDVVRYADSGGYSNDFERPNAWRYRDYVIRTFNNDKPYDQFVREQIAGDELYPGDPEALIATGFLRAGPWEHTAMSVEAMTRQMFLDDVTNAVGITFMGMTLGCARCHDHKFDPLPTKDYYRMQAILASTEFARPKLPFLPDENVSDLPAGRQRIQKLFSDTMKGLKGFDEEVKTALMKKHGVSRVEDVPAEELAEGLKSKRVLGPEAFEHFKVYQKHSQLYKESLDRFEAKAFAVSSGPLDGAGDGGPALKYPKRESYKPSDVHILPGGNIQAPAEKVTPGVPAFVEQYAGMKAPEIAETMEGRRAALAKWISSPEHPLTARVMVNRIWQYHFGRGIAGDTSNFGKMGKKPTHPELLDWLTTQFIENGWSIKSLHRLILLSDTYQRTSSHPAMEEVKARDPNNEYLSYFSPRRLEAEALRDGVLFVAGELSTAAGGPGTFPQINDDVARQPLHRMGSLAPAYMPSSKKSERNRRTIYTFQQRSLVDPFIEVFNGPNLDVSCDRRDTATIPTQSFTMFNSQFMHDMALAFAARLEKETPTPEARIERAFQLAYSRPPSQQESRMALAHLDKLTEQHRVTPPPVKADKKPLVHMITSELTGESFQFTQQNDPEDFEENLHPSEVRPQTRALADLALVLLNSNEFVYIY
jgi:hypothetical protein